MLSLNAPIMRCCASPSGRTGFADPAQQASSLPSRVRLAISPIWCRSLRAASAYPGSTCNRPSYQRRSTGPLDVQTVGPGSPQPRAVVDDEIAVVQALQGGRAALHWQTRCQGGFAN